MYLAQLLLFKLNLDCKDKLKIVKREKGKGKSLLIQKH